MGCISSKAIGRSMSIREELNHGFQSTSVAWEELLTSSQSGNGQLFALVRSTNKRRTSSFTLPSTTDDPQKPIANALDLIPDINEDKNEAKSTTDIVAGDLGFPRFTRSKSAQMLRDETEGLDENKLDWGDKNLSGSRSFHTVEEYDALLERIHKFGSCSIRESYEDHQDTKLEESSKFPDHEEISSSILDKSDNFENAVVDRGETGWKRKKIANRLKSIDVEFPAITRVKNRINVDETYATPKFGSYNDPNKVVIPTIIPEKGGGENTVFSPELLAAFEDCMEQLQVDEDDILSHIDEYLFVDDEMENQVEEVTSDMEIGINTN